MFVSPPVNALTTILLHTVAALHFLEFVFDECKGLDFLLTAYIITRNVENNRPLVGLERLLYAVWRIKL